MKTMAEALRRQQSLMHVSEQPWGNFSQSDYTPDQWHRACLIHLHNGEPTSKDECKLPVRTPGGALSRQGVRAAAAALAGARGGVDASAEEKSKATKALTRYYKELGDEAPESLKQFESFIENTLKHYGVKGMRWGVRNRSGDSAGSSGRKAARESASEDAARVGGVHSRVKAQKSTKMLSNKELQDAITRMNLEQQYSRLTGGLDKTKLQKARAFISDMIQNTAKTSAANFVNSQVKDAIDKKTSQGKYDPVAVAERQAKAAKLRERQSAS